MLWSRDAPGCYLLKALPVLLLKLGCFATSSAAQTRGVAPRTSDPSACKTLISMGCKELVFLFLLLYVPLGGYVVSMIFPG